MEITALLELLCYAAAVERDAAVALEGVLSEAGRALLVEIEVIAPLN